MSLQMGPLEYLEACKSDPREMAILRAVQDCMREHETKKREAGANGNNRTT
jgi:hypothetical protein